MFSKGTSILPKGDLVPIDIISIWLKFVKIKSNWMIYIYIIKKIVSSSVTQKFSKKINGNNHISKKVASWKCFPIL